jgi:hypothetical protein
MWLAPLVGKSKFGHLVINSGPRESSKRPRLCHCASLPAGVSKLNADLGPLTMSEIHHPAEAFEAVGALTDFHIAHLGHFATKGAGLVFIEATSVQPKPGMRARVPLC